MLHFTEHVMWQDLKRAASVWDYQYVLCVLAMRDVFSNSFVVIDLNNAHHQIFFQFFGICVLSLLPLYPLKYGDSNKVRGSEN